MYYFYDKLANWVLLNVYLITGIAVWIFAKQSFHIGSSGLVYGMFGFLFFGGVFRKIISIEEEQDRKDSHQI